MNNRNQRSHGIPGNLFGSKWRHLFVVTLLTSICAGSLVVAHAQDRSGVQNPSAPVARTATPSRGPSPLLKTHPIKPKRPLPMMQSVRKLTAYIAAIEAEAKVAEARRENRATERHRQGDADRSEVATEKEKAAQSHKRINRDLAGTEVAVRERKVVKGQPIKGERDEGEKDKVDYLKARLFYLRQRAYPNDRIDPNAELRAIRQRDQMPTATAIGHRAAGKQAIGGTPGHFAPPSIGLPNQWQFLGPTNLAVPYQIYYGSGPLSGRVNAVAYDPAHAGVYYLAAATGGIWKTTNSGATWTALTDNWPELPVSSLAIDPTNTSVIYAGTGDFDGGYGAGIGIMKSTDGGMTWNKITPGPTDPNDPATGMDGFAVSAILIDPDNHNLITATLGVGVNFYGYIWQSTDGGMTWKSVLQVYAPWSGLRCGAADSTGKRSYYATAPNDAVLVGNNYTDQGAILYRSDDRGMTWTPVKLPTTVQGNDSAIKVTASANFAGVIYLLEDVDEKIWKSTNSGTTWTDITSGFNTAENVPGGQGVSYDWSQSYYDEHIECGTTKNAQGVVQDVVYVGLIDLARSLDGGTTWKSVGGPVYSQTDSLLHNDQHALMINPSNASEVLVGCDGGFYRLTFDAQGKPSYAGLSANLGITEFYHADYHPTDPNTMIGGSQDNATPTALGDLSNWQNEVGGDGAGCAINPLNPAVQYGTVDSYNDIQRTADSWNDALDISPYYYNLSFGNDTIAFIPPLALDPTTPSNVYFATNYLWRYQDNVGVYGQWKARLGNKALAGNGNYVQCIAVAPTDGNRIYTGSVDGQLWMTTNGGVSWTEIDSGTVGLPGLAITSIVVNPTNASSILVGLSGSGSPHLWNCANTLAGATRTWTSLSGNGASALPDVSLNAIALDVDDPLHTFYVGMDVGVFQSLDGGATWQNATAPLGLPNVIVTALKAVPGTRYLNAATYGRGMWHIKLNTDVASVTINQTSVVGGTTVMGTVTITDPAPAGGFPVLLGTDTPAVAAPAGPSVVIPVGQTSTTFTINTSMPVNPAMVTVNISATANGLAKSAALTVQNVAIPHFLMTAQFTRTAAGIVATITLTNNGAAEADNVQINAATLLNNATRATATGSPLPLSFGNLTAGQSNSLTLTFPPGIGNTGDLSLLRMSGTYQQAAPATGSGSFNVAQQQNLP